MKSKFKKLHQEQDRILGDILNEHKDRKQNMKTGQGKAEEDLVDVFLRLQQDGDLEFPLTDNNIEAVIWDILTAGSETSSTTIEWAMSEMLKNPMVMKKAPAEVRRVFDGKGKSCQSNGHEIPTKTRTIVNAWAIARDPKYWIELEKFNPERFLDSPIDYKGTNFTYIPFGTGRRIYDLDMTEIFGLTVKRKNDLMLLPIPYHPFSDNK
ncbi:hypothetical protein ACOSQ3_030753 [Xanthoceras sorbifolium]